MSFAVVLSLCIILMTGLDCAKQSKYRPDAKQLKKNARASDGLFKIKSIRDVCESDEFTCPDGCIPDSYVCDGLDDCDDGFDEKNCSSTCSGINQFKCTNGVCIPASYRCDKDNDCGDGSDEAGCVFTCGSDLFACNNGHCVDPEWVCDGDNDCYDHSDEANCPNRTCSSSQFTCANKMCIPSSYQCDGDNDCTDHSDEAGCTCDSSHFQCAQGRCIPNSYKCDGFNDCGDNSDEPNSCTELHPGACVDLLTFEDCVRMNISSYPICDNYADGHRLCRKFCALCSA